METAMLHTSRVTVCLIVKRDVECGTVLAQRNKNRLSCCSMQTPYQIPLEGQLTPAFFSPFSPWLNKHTVFLATRCWLIVQEDSFLLGGRGGGTGSAAVPSLRVWKWRWQDVDEEARSVTSNRHALECSTLPAGNEPVKRLSAHLSPSHRVILYQPHLHPRDAQKHATHPKCIQYSVLTIWCLFADKQRHIFLRYPSQSECLNHINLKKKKKKNSREIWSC